MTKKICFFSSLILLLILLPLSLYSCAQEYVDADGIAYKRCIDGYAVAGEENGSVDVVIPDTVTSIGMNAFQFSTIQRAVIGNGVKTVGAFAFNQSDLQSVVIGSSVETIGENAFWGTELDCVFIPSSVTGMAANSFDFPAGNWQSIKIFAAAESCPVTWDVVWETKKNGVVWGATQADCDQYQASLPPKKS